MTEKFKVSEFMAAQGQQTKKRIDKYFRSNPFRSQSQCADDLGLSKITVSRYYRELAAEAEKAG